MEKDKLLDIFDQHLKKPIHPVQTQEELIFDVIAEYMHHLMTIGNIPHFLLDELEVDLHEEVLEIYRKKTYGHVSLEMYRNSKLTIKGKLRP